MGRTKKRYNWKSRQVVKTEIDKREEKKIVVEVKGDGHYDEANPLVIPSKKRKTKVEIPKIQVDRLLSKKKRKQLEKIVDRKKKKEHHAALVESCAKLQAKPEELNKMISISAALTKGLKRRRKHQDPFEEFNNIDKVVSAPENGDRPVVPNCVKGAYKRCKLMAVIKSFEPKKKEYNPNIIGFTSSEESSEDEENNETDAKEEITADDTSNNCEVVNESNIGSKIENDDVIVINDNDEGENGKIEENGLTEIKEENGSNEVEKDVTPKISAPSVPATYVLVDRNPEIQQARYKLPILGEEQIIMEAINENPVVLIAGETGSGKTTQVPQFLYEAGYARDGKMIGITEPRRVAAISMAKRVGEELNLSSKEVSYLIRFDGNVTPETKIKFMTDGVLLKEVQSDFLLSKYSVIILDEAHERSVYTDILMGLLSRIVLLRKKRGIPLKLIIMSATLKVEDLTLNSTLFKVRPPVIKVESRQFPVSVHFNKNTNADYMLEAFRKACKIHTRLPHGGILIFVTGQQEVNTLVTKLRRCFPFRKKGDKTSITKSMDSEEEELNLDIVMKKIKKKRKNNPICLPEINLNDYDVGLKDDTEADMLASDCENEEDGEFEDIGMSCQNPLWVLPLYSVLSSSKQAKVFEAPPEGCRLCVVATNVAETSLTIPGVKYVIDTGKVKEKLYDKITGVSQFAITWTSKAAADQRAGRAGRTSPGHCYRLYSSAVFNDEFKGWAVPEMQRRPVDELVLQMKAMGIFKVVNFPFPSSPDLDQLKTAEQNLTYLGALSRTHKSSKRDESWIGKITPLGKNMAKFPVAPRFAKMLCISDQYNLMEYTIAMVAALSVQELLQNVNDGQHKSKVNCLTWSEPGHSKLLGDAMVLLRTVGAAENANSCGKLTEFCIENKVNMKGIIEARKIRVQLTNEINLLCPDLNVSVNPKMGPPTDTQAKCLRQIVLCGMLDQVARKIDEPQESTSKRRPLYHTPLLEEAVQVHSSSVLCKDYPDWIVYQEIYQTNKIYLKGITAIEPEWLPTYAKPLCRLGPPLENPEPRYDPSTGLILCHIKGTFGRRGWELPAVEMEFPPVIDKYKWFSMFLLDGTIFPKLQKFTKSLLSTPKTMIRSWARLQRRTEIFLKTLIQKEVDSKSKLLKVWETEPKYLLGAYQKWLPETFHNETAVMWPPID